MSALEKSCKFDVAVSIFADAGYIPWPCPSGSKFVYIGPFQFMEWRSDSQDNWIILQRQAEPAVSKREIYFTAPEEADLSSNLFQGLACDSCLCALSTKKWSGWSCSHCDAFVAAPPVREQLHRHFAKVNISYTGPRMDNGKAYVDESLRIKRRLVVWNDGLKVSVSLNPWAILRSSRNVDCAFCPVGLLFVVSDY